MFLHRILIVSALASLSLTACSSSTPPVAESPAPIESAAPVVDTKAMVAGMKAVVSKTTIAVTAGDFTKAQSEFEGFENYWKKVEGDMKAKSADTYEQVEKSINNTEEGLRATKPDKAGVIVALQSLSKTLNGYYKP
jgi:hypothetical protein